MAAGGPQTDPPGLVPQSTRPALHLLARHAQGPRVARAAHPHCRAVRYMNEHALLGSGMGMIIGAILALTGAGGGILAVPLLVFGLGLSIAQAAPVGLLAVGLAAGVGALLGLRQGIVRYRAAAYIAGVGVLLTPLGLWLAHHLPNEPLALGFAVVMVYACGRIFLKARKE